MNAEKPPIRITKQRAQAFLDVFARGLEERIAEVKENYGVTLHLDGTTDFDPNEGTQLLEPGEIETLEEIVDATSRAIDTAAIFRRRYG